MKLDGNAAFLAHLVDFGKAQYSHIRTCGTSDFFRHLSPLLAGTSYTEALVFTSQIKRK